MEQEIQPRREVLKLLLVVLLLLLILGSFILYLAWPLMTGQAIVLALRPVDPFDPLRGQYIVLNYEISSLPAPEGAREGSTVYILLKEDEQGIWRYKSASLSRPEKGIVIAGTVRSLYSNTMNLEYGIEQYFFERHAQLPTQNLTVEVKVSADGNARISQLLHNGKPAQIIYENKSWLS